MSKCEIHWSQMSALGHVHRKEDTFDAAVTHTLQVVGKADLVLKEPQENTMIDVCFLGKSICYETLPFLYNFKLSSSEGRSRVLVISPLVSFMTDQVTSSRRGVSAIDVKG